MERTTTRSKGPQRGQRSESAFSLDEFQEWKTQLETVVRDHPILSAGIAVGAGVLIARLVKDAFDDEKDRKRRRRRRGSIFGSEIGRAIMGSIATMAAAKLQEALIEHVQEEEEEAEPEPQPVPRRPRKQGTGRRPPARRRKVEE